MTAVSVNDAHRALADINQMLVVSAICTLAILALMVWALCKTASRADTLAGRDAAESWQPNRDFIDWDADEDLAA